MPDSENLKSGLDTEEEPVEEYVYKILVVGDLGCGKTSFIHRYVNHTFSNTYRATIGVDFALKTLRWDTKTSIRLQLWDISQDKNDSVI